MPRKLQKSEKDKTPQIVAVKDENELAQFLDRLPNQSEFIRRAILAQSGVRCRLGTGSGVVDKGTHGHIEPVIAESNARPCEKCKMAVTFPMTVEAAAPPDRDRIRQFLHGGPLYCAKCYGTAPPCHDCGWHVMMEK